MHNSLLEISSLTTFTNNSINLTEVNFSLEKSQIHSLIGERGVGKSVFVNCLLGKEKKFVGSIKYKGEEVSEILDDINRKKINFLIKEPMLADGLKVYENLFLIKDDNQSLFQRINHRALKKKTEEIFRQLNVTIDYRKFVHELTVEEKKVLEIAKLYHYKPDIVVMLEPTESLSKKSREIFFNLIKKLQENGTGIIYVTNKWEEALKVADKISIIYEGKIIEQLPSSEARKNPVKLLQLISGQPVNKHIEDEYELIQQENEDVIDAIFKATEYLTSNYELNDVLMMVCKYSSKIMNASSSSVYLIDDSTHTVMDFISHEKKKDYFSQLKTNVVMEIMKKDKPFYSSSAELDFDKKFKQNKKIKSILCYPILIRSNKTALVVASYDVIFSYEEKHLKYLKTLSKQAAIAIDNTRLLGKSTLLQETHHRIKNNLQTITSLIIMQKNNYKKTHNQNFDELIEDIVSRIKSIAVIHDLLSKDVEGRSIVNTKELINALLSFYVINGQPEIQLDLEDIFIPYNKTTSVSLIINELLNNCTKHAFKDIENGIIEISCKEIKEELTIKVSDNGKGLPEDFKLADLKSLGLFFVNSIVKYDFTGKFEIYNNNGTTAIIRIPREKLLLSKA